MTLLKELTRFFTPVPGLPAPSTAPVVTQTLPSIFRPEKGSELAQTITEEKEFNDELTPSKSDAPISTSVKWSENKIQKEDDTKKQEPVSGGLSDTKSVGPPLSTILRTESPSPYRLHQYGTEKPRNIDNKAMFENDPDYIELLAKCNIKDYYGDISEKTHSLHRVPQRNSTLEVEYSRRRLHTLPATGSQWNSSPKMAKIFQSRKTAQLHER